MQTDDTVELLYRCEAHISGAVLSKTERASACGRLRVHFEDEHVAVVEKPPGLAMSGMGDASFQGLSLNELLIVSLVPSQAECGAHRNVDSRAESSDPVGEEGEGGKGMTCSPFRCSMQGF